MISDAGTSAACSLQRSCTTSFWRMVLAIPDDGRVSPHAPTLLNTHAILLGDPSLTCTGISRWRWEVPVHKFSYLYFPPGCGRSRPERAKRQWCHQVCPRPLRRVEEASVMGLPHAPEHQNVTAAQNVFLKCAGTRIERTASRHKSGDQKYDWPP